MAKLNQKQKDLKNYMIKNDWILEEVMELVLTDMNFMNPPGIHQTCKEMETTLQNKLLKGAA